MNEIKINLDNLTAEERDQLMKLVEKGNKKSKVWKPEKDEGYWYLSGSGELCLDYYGMSVDVRRWELGNCFSTKEEAEEEATRRKMMTRWKRLSIEAGEGENPWDGESGHWLVYYDGIANGLAFDIFRLDRHCCVHFPTEQSIKAAVAELGEENVMKYILGVRE